MKYIFNRTAFFFFYFLCSLTHFFSRTVSIEEINNTIQLLHKRAEQYYFNRQFDSAITLYKKIIKIDPNISSAHCNIGFILATCYKDFEQAIKYLKKALEIKPTYAKAYFFLGNALHSINKTDQALIAYNQALIHNPDYKDVYPLYARALWEHYNFTNAHEAQRYISECACSKQLAYYVGKLFERSGYVEDAIQLYQEALVKPFDIEMIQHDMQSAYHKQLEIRHQLQHYYQDIIINNITVSSGNKKCHERYLTIQKILNQYKRPITVLDLNPQQGYFSFRIAHDYNATCVMLSSDNSLVSLCEKNDLVNGCVVLAKNITAKDLQRLSECEHFDVVLALDGTIAWFEKDHELIFELIKKLGDHIIIETPFVEVSSYTKSYLDLTSQYIVRKGSMMIHETSLQKSKYDKPYAHSHMYLLENPRNTLKRTHWTRGHQTDEYRIESTFENKFLLKYPDWSKHQWIRGINLLTFVMLEGSYPTRPHIAQQLNNVKQTLRDIGHTDIRICNFIIQGNNIAPIDCDDPRGNTPKNPDISIAQIIDQLYMKPNDLYGLVS